MSFPCVIKQLPGELLVPAMRESIRINPQNAVSNHRAASTAGFAPLRPEHLALLTSYKWGNGKVNLGVTFLDTTNVALKNKILAYANKWGKVSNTTFRESAAGEVRLSLGGSGYWSYLGNQILSVAAGQPTLNLQGFSLSTPDSEYDRVVCHEFGHTMGFPHEHERQEILNLLDVEKTVKYFSVNVGWDRQTVMQQVFDPIDPATITSNTADVRSIMCYEFDGQCTKSGQPIPGGNVIDVSDAELIGKIYPLTTVNPPPPPPLPPSTGKYTGTGTGTASMTVFGFKMTPTVTFSNLSLTLAPAASAVPSNITWPKLPPFDWAAILKRAQIAGPIILAGLAAGKSWPEILTEVAAAELAAGQQPQSFVEMTFAWPTLPPLNWAEIIRRAQIAAPIIIAGLAAGKTWAVILEEVAMAELSAQTPSADPYLPPMPNS